MNNLLYAIIALFIASSGYSGKVDVKQVAFENKLPVMAFVQKQIPDINKFPSSWKVRILRDYVYRKTKIGSNGDFSANHAQMINILSGKVPLLCGGISATYLALLQIYEIPARYIQLYTCKNYMHIDCDTHVGIEVFLDNKWIAQDPTFNVEWTYDGENIGYKELKSLYRNGKKPVDESNGFNVLKDRSIDDYYLPYEQLVERQEIRHYQLYADLPTR